MQRLLSVVLAAILLVCPCIRAASAAKMETDVPVWTEETVRSYLQSYAQGRELDRLYGYYDIQIRRYMPPAVFETMLTELWWLTGEFLALGGYSSFAEEERGTRTHVVHLHMEKQDLDAYFTHKDRPDDWEVLSLEFIPAEKQPVDLGYEVGASESDLLPYREFAVALGEGTACPLEAVITLPASVPQGGLAAACVLVQDAEAPDKDTSISENRFFRSIARELAKNGIASIRYDKRTHAYPKPAHGILREEATQDALLAMELLYTRTTVPREGIILVGHGLSGALVPGIAAAAVPSPAGMLLIGSAAAEEHIECIRTLELPVYVVQGQWDVAVPEERNYSAYTQALEGCPFAAFQCYRGLDHLLAKDLSTGETGLPLYAFDAGIDAPAVRDMAEWIRSVVPQVQTMEVEQ